MSCVHNKTLNPLKRNETMVPSKISFSFCEIKHPVLAYIRPDAVPTSGQKETLFVRKLLLMNASIRFIASFRPRPLTPSPPVPSIPFSQPPTAQLKSMQRSQTINYSSATIATSA